ncbi:type 1 fimbrial protein [Burkholderia sp. Bp9002]|nr:type 1 fimbrial protein [Burkholderia sp. Bp9002]
MRKVDRTMMRAIARITVAAVCVLSSAPALAKCRFMYWPTNPLEEAVTFSDGIYSRDTAIGTTTTQSSRQYRDLMCDASTYETTTTATVVNGELVPGYTNVYKTGIDGIGIKLFSAAYGFSNTRPAPFELSAPSPGNTVTFFAKAQLIVTGPVRGGTIKTLPSLLVTFKQGADEPQAYTLSVNGNISIVAKACKLTDSAINVRVPQVVYQRMQAPGSVSGETGFNIGLTNCPDGLSVYATLADATDPTNVSTILKPAPESTARGFGYQVLYRGSPIGLGPDSSAPGTKNQFLVGTTAGPSLEVPLSVRYVRTSDAFAPGTVIGRVILNMSYQ